MATQRKSAKPVGPFQAVNPPEDVGAPPEMPMKPLTDEMKPSPEVLRKADEEERLSRLRDESGRAENISRRSAMGTLKRASGGSVSSASKRADGCAQRGKTKGRFV
jgi:hypothetical protein